MKCQKSERKQPHTEPYRKADAFVSQSEVDGLVAEGGIQAKAQNCQKSRQKEGGKPCGQPDQEGLEPAKIAHGYAEEGAFATSLSDLMYRSHQG